MAQIIELVKICSVFLVCFSILLLVGQFYSSDSLRLPFSGDSPAIQKFRVVDEDGSTWNEFEVVEFDPKIAEDLKSGSGEAENEKQDANNDRFVSGESPAPARELKRDNITDENGVMTSDMFEGMYYGPIDLSLSADEAEAIEKKRQEQFQKVRVSEKLDDPEPMINTA